MIWGCTSYLWVAGVCVVVYHLFKIANYFVRIWNESLWSKTVDFQKYGKWAVVTGGSDGIGKALAMEFARSGMNIFILARTEHKLENVEKEIKSMYSVGVKTLAVDFSKGDIYQAIQDEIGELDIGVLVNNVGMTHPEPIALLDIPNVEKFSNGIAHVNTFALMKLTAMILPQMTSRKGGIVVNVSSVLGSTITPFFALYGATKSCMNTFTEAMRLEYSHSGVIFQCIAPAITATPAVASRTKSNFMIPSSGLFGKYAIKAIGKSAYTNTSFLWHNVFQLILYILPNVVFFNAMRMGVEDALIRTKKL